MKPNTFRMKNYLQKSDYSGSVKRMVEKVNILLP